MSWNTSWGLYGNANTSISNFLGTTDARPLYIKTSDKVALRISVGGDVSIGMSGGTRSPDYKLDVGGILNADEIYKNGTSLVSSPWVDADGSISYGGNVSINGQLSVVRPWSDWMFLQQQRDVEGGGGFHVHNPWGDSTAPQGAADRNRLEIAYRTAAGQDLWGQFVIHGPTGNIGVGTVNPQRRLQVGDDVGGMGFMPSNGSPNAGYVRWGDNTGWKLHFGRSRESSGGTLNIGTAGILMTLQDDGTVGIGTSSPGSKLHVHGGRLRISESDGPQSSSVLELSNGTKINYVFTDSPTGHLHLRTDSAAHHVTLQAGGAQGNVGIGTSSPEAKLQVSGGAIMPTIGNSAVAGIQFPANPGGGGGDEAFIRYFVESGETTKLLIGCQNDADDRISFYQAGAERLTLFNGRVGIGTLVPARPLHISTPGSEVLMLHSTRGGAGSTASLDFQTYATIDQIYPTASVRAIDDGLYSSHVVFLTKASGANANALQERMRISSNGNVGVGITNPEAKLHVGGGLWNPTDTEADFKIGDATYRLKIGVATGGGGAGDVRIRAHGGTNRLMLGSGTLDTLFVNGDRVGIGTMTPAAKLDVTGGDVRIEGRLGTSGYSPIPRNPGWGGGIHTWDIEAEATIWTRTLRVENGAVISPGSNELWFFKTPAIGSDSRLKRNVEPLVGALDKLAAIRGVSYKRVIPLAPAARSADPREIGVIAQEVEAVFPELVSAHGEENFKAVNFGGLTSVLIEATKELKAQNDELRSRIEALEQA